MDYKIDIDEFGYMTITEKDGPRTRIHLTRSSLLELHAQAFDAALQSPDEPPGHGPITLRPVD